MPEITVTGSSDGEEVLLSAAEGEPVYDVLLRNNIPPPSVVVTADGDPIALDHEFSPGPSYEALVVEGYDLASIRSLYRFPGSAGGSIYTRRRLSIDDDGGTKMNYERFGGDGVEEHVERLICETIEQYGLVEAGDKVVVGLSGGIDSSALLAGLNAVRGDLPPFDLVAVTVENPWPGSTDESVARAELLAEAAGVEHRVLGRREIRDVFGLTEPITDVIESLYESEYGNHVVAITDQVLTRLLERYAEDNDADRVALGVHGTELVAGILNADIGGYEVGGAPERTFGELSLVYPLCLLSKQELALYYYVKAGTFQTADEPDVWNYHPDDWSLYYFLADIVQWYWPGVQYWLVESRGRGSDEACESRRCENCGKVQLPETSMSREQGLCAVCSLLARQGYLRQRP